jgi:thymidine kinase
MSKSGDVFASRFDLYVGTMFGGKTEAMIKDLEKARFSRLYPILFKPRRDNRTNGAWTKSHSALQFPAKIVNSSEEVFRYISRRNRVVGFEELQFFESDILPVIIRLVEEQKKWVIGAALDLDFRGQPFPTTTLLMPQADRLRKKNAICTKCGNRYARYSQRLVDCSEIEMVGGENEYAPRCRTCFVRPK